MRRCAQPLPILIALALGASAGCGKRADPLAPYLKNPQPPSGLEVSQQGDSVEIRIIAPRTTTQSRPLPVIELEWFQAPAIGDFGKTAVPILREEVAPGELRIKRFPIPAADARFSVRAYNGRARSNPATPVAFKPTPVPAVPRGVEATNLPTGVELRWINPPGAEPWPTATPTPTPSPSPSPPPSPGAAPLTPAGDFSGAKAPLQSAKSQNEPANEPPTPTPTSTPAAAPLPAPTPLTESRALPSATESGTKPVGSPLASPAAAPAPTPTPVLPTAIRIFRTDGTLRLAREPLQASSWLDTAVRPGEKACYSLRYASSLKPLVESAPTEPVCLEVKDLVLPEPPERMLGDIGDSFVELSWPPSPSGDVDFYRVYRTAEWEARAMIIQTEGLLLRVRDLRMTSGRRTYEVTAVDKGGNESLPSPPVRIIVP